MDFLKGITGQIPVIWREASVAARIGAATVASLLIAAIVGVGMWSSRPEYVPLAVDLAPAEAAELISKLDAEGIEHKLNYSGSGVAVSRADWNRARLIAGDLVGPVSADSPEFQESILSDPTMNHYRILRNQEEALARSLSRMKAVVSAKVHIGRPDPSPFLDGAQPATASVVLELRQGILFTREQVASVVSLVANSTEGLSPDNVSVLDTGGKLLTASTSGPQGDVATQYEFRRRVEADLAAKAESMLAEMLGQGRAVVRVTANIDFTEMESTQTTFDPDSKVKKSEKIRSVQRTGGDAPSKGPAGIASNVGLLDSKNGSGVLEKEEDTETEYENAQTVDTVRKASGAIQRLTVAATVDLPSEDKAAAADSTAAPAVTKAQVESIIRQAVGFDDTRNDQIEVVVAPLAGSPFAVDAAPVPGTNWSQWLELARNASLGLASLTALGLGFFVLRRLKPVPVEVENKQEPVTSNPQLLGELAREASEQPQLVAQILATWLGEELISEIAEGETEQIAQAA